MVQSLAGKDDPEKVLDVEFYCTEQGNEPVREWLKDEVGSGDRKEIGKDIKTVQFGWPLGMPTVRKLEAKLWEVRTSLGDGIARVFLLSRRYRLVSELKIQKQLGLWSYCMALSRSLIKRRRGI